MDWTIILYICPIMRNFDYLQQIPALRDLYNFCNAAEEMQHADHDSCGWNCRKALEWMVRAVYKLKHQPVGERDNLYTLSTGKTFTDLIGDDDKLMMAVHYIRMPSGHTTCEMVNKSR